MFLLVSTLQKMPSAIEFLSEGATMQQNYLVSLVAVICILLMTNSLPKSNFYDKPT